MPTVKQKEVFTKVVKGSNISTAMRTSGYADSTSKRTNKITKSKGWEQLMKTYIPDKQLALKHKQFLDSDKEEIGIKALDIGYKIKGYYPKEGNNTAIQINVNRFKEYE
jgi:hypothetical protein